MKNKLSDRVRISAIACALSVFAACGGGEQAAYTNTAPILPVSGIVNCPTFAVGNTFSYSNATVATLDQSVSSLLQPVVDALLNAKNLNFTSTVTIDAVNADNSVNMSEAYSGDVTGTDTYVVNSTASNFSVLSVDEKATKQATTTYAGTGFQLCVPPAAGDVFTATVISGGVTKNAEITIDQVGTQSVTTPAGTFLSARRIDSTLRILNADGTYAAGQDIISNLWFDDVVGEVVSVTKIAISVTDSSSGQTFNATLSNTQQLTSYVKP